MSINIIEKPIFAIDVKLKARTQDEINKKRCIVIETLEKTIKTLEEQGIIEKEETFSLVQIFLEDGSWSPKAFKYNEKGVKEEIIEKYNEEEVCEDNFQYDGEDFIFDEEICKKCDKFSKCTLRVKNPTDENTKEMTSGYLYINPKDMEKTDKEARKIYGDDFDKAKTFSIETTLCPLCEKRAKESLHKATIENQARVDKYGLGEDIEDDDSYFKCLKEFRLKFKCPCFEYDEKLKKFNKKEKCPFEEEDTISSVIEEPKMLSIHECVKQGLKFKIGHNRYFQEKGILFHDYAPVSIEPLTKKELQDLIIKANELVEVLNI